MNMSAAEIRLASNILSEENTDGMVSHAYDDDFEKLYVTDSEENTSVETELNPPNHQQKMHNLIYNESDEENENHHRNNSKMEHGIESSGKDIAINSTEEKSRSSQNAIGLFDTIVDSQDIRNRLEELEDNDADSDNETGNILRFLNAFSILWSNAKFV